VRAVRVRRENPMNALLVGIMIVSGLSAIVCLILRWRAR
jgi:hypothetical protein